MDMAPPEAPPVIARTTAEEPATLVQRMADTQRWLIDQRAFVPTVPVHGEPSARMPFMEDLAASWQAPVAPYPAHRPIARMQAFALRWAAVMADAARLGVADDELGEREEDAILAFTGAQGHIVPPHMRIRELMVTTLPYAGAYVEIDLARLRDRQRADGTFEFNLYTVTNRSNLEFVIKPTLPAPQRGIAPLSPTRQRDLPGIPLKAGEFRTGLRSP
jgi:hypothetical protein